MKIVYVTDLHGCKWKYEKTLIAAQDQGVNAVINGGDMYPKNIALEKQHNGTVVCHVNLPPHARNDERRIWIKYFKARLNNCDKY